MELNKEIEKNEVVKKSIMHYFVLNKQML